MFQPHSSSQQYPPPFFSHIVIMLLPAVIKLLPAVIKLSPAVVTWSPCRCTPIAVCCFIVANSHHWSLLTHITIMQYLLNDKPTKGRLRFLYRSVSLSCDCRQLLLGCLVIVAKVIKSHKILLHFLATFAFCLPSRYRISVVIWCERDIRYLVIVYKMFIFCSIKMKGFIQKPRWLINRLVLNTEKTVCMILSTYQHRATLTNFTLNLKVGDKPIKQVNEAKLLGIIIDERLT